MCAITGYEVDELIGRHFSELLAESCRESVSATAQQIFASRSEIRSLLNELVAKDGRHVLVLTNGKPILDDDGSLIGYCGSDHDVTDLLRTRFELEHFKSVMDHANFGIALADADSQITYANQAFAGDHGFEPEEIIGQPIAFLHAPSQMERVEQLISLIHSKGRFSGEEVWHRRKDGTEFPMLMTGVLLTGEDGTRHLAATALDITDRKRAEQELVAAKEKAEESDRIKSAFLSMTSHEFRTPLNHILGFSSLIAETAPDPEIASYARLIQKSADDFLEMVNGLIELATVEASSIRPRNEPFALSDFLERTSSTLRTLVEESGNAGRIHIQPPASPVPEGDLRIGDAGKLHLMLLQILRNAVEFTPAGTVGLACDEPEPGLVRFCVSDTGPGIPSGMAQGIFEPFVQGESGITRHHSGMGIGLAVSRKIATVLDGEVRLARSDASGTVVEVIVPLPRAE